MRFFPIYIVMYAYVMAGFASPSRVKAPPLVDTFRKQLALAQLCMHYRNGYPAYRIQVINTNEKSKALHIISDLSLIAPKVPIHFTYREPYYRVRVGAFRTETEAEPLRRRIDLYYAKKNIVLTLPEVISLNEAINVFIKQEKSKNYDNFLTPLPSITPDAMEETFFY